ncbi:MAG: S41 family peptidase [Clostridia bacterium]|nr:S41 family peptidase [Clostridia bacterium]MBQ9925061.1 S41 family peptidase [Clostridia bacterium]
MNKKSVNLGTCLMLIFLAVVTTANVCVFGMTEMYNRKLGDLQAAEAKYDRLEELMAVVDKYYVGEYDMDAAMDGVLAGFIDGVGDKWSYYCNAEEYEALKESNANSYVGIGVTISTEYEGGYAITDVTGGSPAEQAGLRPFDVITSVDGVGTDTFEDYSALVNVVRGEEGTVVNIGIRRGEENLTFDITRAAVFNPGIEARMIGEIGYISIDGFDRNVDVEFAEELNALVSQGAKGLVFDVRFNGGGYVDVMSNMLDLLLPEGTIITMSDNSGETTEYRSKEGQISLPMVVLTNEYSISAAEFFAAVLQEYGVATVVGDHTTGKGYAQTIIPLTEGAVNLSTLKYYTPKGVSLADVGIQPDIEISLSDEDFYNFYSLTDQQDTQLQKALETLGVQPAPVEPEMPAEPVTGPAGEETDPEPQP